MAGNVVAYGYQMAMSRMLTPAEYGVVTTLTAVSYVLAVLMRTFQAWVIKATNDTIDGVRPQPRAIFTAAARTLVPLGIGVFALVVLTAGWTGQFLQLDDLTPITMLGLFAFCSILLPLVSGLLLGLGKLRRLASWRF